MMKPESYVAVYSQENSIEPFFICKVIQAHFAEDEISDDYQHTIPAGSLYTSCYYLEKTDENLKKGFVQYKLCSSKEVYVLKEQIFCPTVKVTEDMRISMKDYLWLSDMI